MIVYKMWFTESIDSKYRKVTKTWGGWFLLGLIPLYIYMREIQVK